MLYKNKVDVIKMKKKILIGSIFAVLLMLMMPCISAVNVQTVESEIKNSYSLTLDSAKARSIDNNIIDKVESLLEKFQLQSFVDIDEDFLRNLFGLLLVIFGFALCLTGVGMFPGVFIMMIGALISDWVTFGHEIP